MSFISCISKTELSWISKQGFNLGTRRGCCWIQFRFSSQSSGRKYCVRFITGCQEETRKVNMFPCLTNDVSARFGGITIPTRRCFICASWSNWNSSWIRFTHHKAPPVFLRFSELRVCIASSLFKGHVERLSRVQGARAARRQQSRLTKNYQENIYIYLIGKDRPGADSENFMIETLRVWGPDTIRNTPRKVFPHQFPNWISRSSTVLYACMKSGIQLDRKPLDLWSRADARLPSNSLPPKIQLSRYQRMAAS